MGAAGGPRRRRRAQGDPNDAPEPVTPELPVASHLGLTILPPKSKTPSFGRFSMERAKIKTNVYSLLLGRLVCNVFVFVWGDLSKKKSKT